MKRHQSLYLLALTLLLCLGGCSVPANGNEPNQGQSSTIQPDDNTQSDQPIQLDAIPTYAGEPYVVINGNIPDFTHTDTSRGSYEYYSELDDLERCGPAEANIGLDLMPTEERSSIGQVKPTGWQTVKYDIVEGKYLYNRCHLIGFQLTGENANEKNLITGTRYMNVEGMLPFENMVADFIKETENHVLYRVTPIFIGDDLVVKGVQMEAMSVEDQGEGIQFNVFVYNVQPGIEINYATGESFLAESANKPGQGEITYILNIKTKKFHLQTCSSVQDIKEDNKGESTDSREQLISQGYEPCGRCNP